MLEGSISLEDKNTLLLFGGLCLFFGVVTISGLFSLIKGTKQTLRLLPLLIRGQKVMGEVVNVHTTTIGSNGGSTYTLLTVGFVAFNGEALSFRSYALGYYEVGDYLSVRYLTDNPSIAELTEVTPWDGGYEAHLLLY
ncbi:hypothetical protein KSC_090000 [Ktedonobacter sp. SOSP1-52]|uniref:DUF3592 domain-containing protein n=1 Tax=Ktedonobacter sp. SOSP1-52 TaxID=2778366 RepID=UPI00191528FD|nr:DUF3592 domain-containing protein [Ktedonobacter sp. SOSP1-52]GHO70108.1 hypothetical protein KSC_090000 [Ktedonobacter sp. SOSP1-52]